MGLRCTDRWMTFFSGCCYAAVVAMAPVSQAVADDPNNPTGQSGLLLIDKRGAKIEFLDPSSYRLLDSIDVEKNPHELAISPDHKTAYVTIYGTGVYGANPNPGHSILIVNLLTHKLQGQIDVSPYLAPHGIMVDAQGTLYVTCDVIRKLLIIDPSSRRITGVIDTEGTGHFLAITPDASKAYISNKTDRDYISVVDLHSKMTVRHIPAPGGTEGLAISPDGSRAVVALHARPSLLVIDTATDKVIDEVALRGFPINSNIADHLVRVRFTPDGSKLLAAYHPSDVVSVMPANDLRQQTLIRVGKGPMGLAFTSDGKTALVGEHDAGTIAVLDLQGQGRYSSDFAMGVGVETLAFY